MEVFKFGGSMAKLYNREIESALQHRKGCLIFFWRKPSKEWIHAPGAGVPAENDKRHTPNGRVDHGRDSFELFHE